MLEYIMYIAVVLATMFTNFNCGTLFKMLALDSLVNSVVFLKTYINSNLTETEVVSISNSVYTESTLNRYVCYTTVYISYITLCNMLWIDSIPVIEQLLFTTAVPYIVNYIVQTPLMKTVIKKKENIISVIISKHISLLLKLYSKSYLKKEVTVDNKRILTLLDNYDTTMNCLCSMCKNIVVLSVMSYIKNYSTDFYYKISKYIYVYNTGDTLESYTELSAKKYLEYIIDNEQWDELLKPNTYKAVVRTLQVESKEDYFKNLVTTVNYSACLICALWTVSSSTDTVYLAPLLHMILNMYKGNNILYYTPAYLVSWFVGIYTESFLLTSILSHTLHQLLVSRLMCTLYNCFYTETVNWITSLNDRNKDCIVPALTTCVYMSVQSCANNYVNIVMNMIYILTTGYNTKRWLVYIGLLVSGCISDFNLIHLIHNTVLLYIVTGCMDTVMYIVSCTVKQLKKIDRSIKYMFKREMKLRLKLMDNDIQHRRKNNSINDQKIVFKATDSMYLPLESKIISKKYNVVSTYDGSPLTIIDNYVTV